MLGADARFQSIYVEHVDAESLDRLRLASNTFSGTKSDAQRILSDVNSALHSLHKEEIIHGDLKPANILYSKKRGAVLIDFGLSFVNGNPRQSGGSPWYLPPEFLADWHSLGPPYDMWALGVTMLWLLGFLPFPDNSKNWQIADIHPLDGVEEPHRRARKVMGQWIRKTADARLKLRQGEALEEAVGALLEPDMNDRINAARLEVQMRELCTDPRR
jgi:serine/threonine protein kinase